MKKALIIGICVLAAAITVFGFISLRNAALSEETDLLTTLPERPAMLVTIQQPEALTQSLCYNNGFWQYWRKNPSIRLLNVLLTETDSARESKQPLQTNNPIQIAVFFNERQTSSLLSARLSANDWQYWKKRLAHYPLLHNRYENGVLLVSADSAILANASHNLSKRISVLENDTAFLQVRNTAGKQVPMSIYLCHNAWNKLFVQSTGTPSEEADALFNSDAAWSVLDFEASERQFRLCGFAVSDNKTSSLERLRQQMPAPNKLAAALPNGTYYYHHEVINDLEAYRTANGAIRAIEDSMWRTADGTSTLSFFRQYFDGEWIHGLNNDGSFVVVRLNDAASASRDLEKLAEGLHAGQGMPGVYRFGLCGFAASVLGEQARLNREFVSIQGNNLWITSQPGKAAAYAQGPKLTETAAYKAAESDMQTESVQTDYFEIQTLLAKIDKQVTDSWAARHIGWIALGCPFGTAVLQSEYSSVGLTYCNFTAKQAATPLQLAHQPLTNGELLAYNEIHEAQPVQEQATTVSSDVIEPTEDSTVEELPVAVAKTEPLPDSKSRTTVSEMLVQVQLDAPAAMRPQIFKNHLNGENEIVVQDTKKQLYLISATGKIVWKIQLSEFILGDVFAVDMLGNKKWQMTFVTPSKWFVIDRKGNNLAGFPIALNPQASAGLQVVDYENKADYRFFIPRKGGKV
ncbi:MAG: hypothetical protein J5808_07160, partial [Paludibacteraceae bacterium]|nr:hypothetical protein [Paludibacteraceae bacterium]